MRLQVGIDREPTGWIRHPNGSGSVPRPAEKAGWRRKSGPVKNLDLVKELISLYRAHPDVDLAWIRAHVGQRWNEYADRLASRRLIAEK